MSWYKNYKIYFQSRTGTQYCVYILEQTEGTSHTLLGAAEPFVTQEDDDDDIFTPIRKQTGYLRIVGDPNVDIMEVLMPKNNVEKMVQLWSGTWNADMTTFSDGTLQWQGFLVAQAFSQPAENGRHIIEFPVKSMLGALEDIYMDYEDVSRINHICWLLAQASMALMNSSTQSPWSEYYFIDDVDHIGSGIDSMFPAMAYPFMDWSVLYDDIDTKNDGLTTSSVSYYDALSHVCSLFGAQIREQGTKLYISQYDNASQCRVKKLLWAAVRRSQGTSLMPHTDIGALSSDSQTLPDITFLIKGSQKNYIPGASKFEVNVKLVGKKYTVTPGETDPSETATIYTVACINNVNILSQPQATATGRNIENYYYKAHFVSYQDWPSSYSYAFLRQFNFTTTGDSTYADCVSNSVMVNRQRLEPGRSLFVSGAFPVRWSTGGILRSGLWLNLQPVSLLYFDDEPARDTYTQDVIYQVKNTSGLFADNGYLNLSFALNRFESGSWNGIADSIRWNGTDPFLNYVVIQVGICIVKNGTSYYYNYNGSAYEWTTTPSSFGLKVSNGTVESNASQFQNLSAGGFYIPVNGEISSVRLDIYNICGNGHSGRYGDQPQIFSVIMSDLKVIYASNPNITGSTDSDNRYFKYHPSGFTGSKQIETIIGTFNNNQPNASFIQTYDSTQQTYNNIESFVYRRDSSERPEMHLLDRMVAHGSEVRKNITYCVRSFVADLMQTIYQKGSKYFFGVDAKHDWREDEQEIKFIEITDEI